MVSAVAGVRVVIIATQQLMTSCTGCSHQQRYQHALNHRASIVQIESILMGSPWSPGRVESCWFGMRHAPPYLPRHTPQVPPERQGLWQLKRRKGRKPNMRISSPCIASLQWPLRHLVFLGQRLCILCGSLANDWSV